MAEVEKLIVVGTIGADKTFNCSVSRLEKMGYDNSNGSLIMISAYGRIVLTPYTKEREIYIKCRCCGEVKSGKNFSPTLVRKLPSMTCNDCIIERPRQYQLEYYKSTTTEKRKENKDVLESKPRGEANRER